MSESTLAEIAVYNANMASVYMGRARINYMMHRMELIENNVNKCLFHLDWMHAILKQIKKESK